MMRYDEGITAEHVIASGSLPVNFEYSKLEVECCNFAPNSMQVEMQKTTARSNTDYRKEMRYFWDGGLMANTPLSQLFFYTEDTGTSQRGLKDKVPTGSMCNQRAPYKTGRNSRGS